MSTTNKEYIDKKHSELWDQLGCFFAFSNIRFKEQYDKAKVDKPVKYVAMGAGLYCPKPNVNALIKGMEDIKNQWKEDRKSNEKVKLVFKGIDNWNRPVWKDPEESIFFGSVDELFSWGATEEEVLKKVDIYNLCYFGTKFGCEPMGTDVPDKYYL
jgi:hypothetical protein